MVIDKIGNVGKIFKQDKPQAPKAKAESKSLGSDSVSISQEALKAADVAKGKQAVKNTAEIRKERVEEVKAKLARGDYDKIDNEILEKVADKIAQHLIR